MDNTSVSTPLALYLIARMQERGIKPADLARASDLTEATISMLVNGQIRDPRTKTVCRLARGLGVNSCEVHHVACETAEAA